MVIVQRNLSNFRCKNGIPVVFKFSGTTPFTCFDGEVVIEVRQLCDGNPDCPGEEDEQFCGGSNGKYTIGESKGATRMSSPPPPV